jgi:hypothetical protein
MPLLPLRGHSLSGMCIVKYKWSTRWNVFEKFHLNLWTLQKITHVDLKVVAKS